MAKQITKKILDCKLIKFEKLFNQSERKKYYYNLQLEGIEDLLLLESHQVIPKEVIGMKIKYRLNAENEVTEFELL